MIRPKSGLAYSNDYCMGSANYVGFQAPEGLHVNQRLYTDDTELRDEWILEFGYRHTLLALKEYENGVLVPRNEYFDTVTPYIQDFLGDDIYSEFYEEISKNEMKTMLFNSELFIVQTHGAQFGFALKKISDLSDDAPFSELVDRFLLMADINTADLSGLKCALLLTCSTAQDYSISHITSSQPVNIVEKMVCQGAETVIGFSETTAVFDCNQFAEVFIRSTVQEGMTVTEALEAVRVDQADRFYYYNIADSCVIAGNTDLTLN